MMPEDSADTCKIKCVERLMLWHAVSTHSLPLSFMPASINL